MSKELMVQVVNDFGREIGAQLDVDDEAYCCLAVDDNFQIHLKFNEHFGGMLFYSELSEVPRIGRKEILRHYVMENGSVESNNLTFSYDHDSKSIGIACLLPRTFMNADNFKKLLQKLIERREKEKEDMARFNQGELPRDNIKFASSGGGESMSGGGMGNMAFMRL